MATLIAIDGPSAGTAYALAAHKIAMIGRDSSCSFQIVDQHVSRRHVQIIRTDDDGHRVKDRGSANGVLLNGIRMDENSDATLREGDEISIGQTRLLYTQQDDPSAVVPMADARNLNEYRRSTIRR